MKIQHTPGPWSYWPNCVRDGGMVTKDNNGTHIAAPNLYFKREETEANARLIAAAPDLLEALNAAEDLLHRMGMQSSDAYQEIDAAIAKATGGAV